MVINKWKKYILPVISAGLIYGACHINDIKKAYNTYLQKPYHEFVSENEFIPDGTQFYDLSDYRQALLAIYEGLNNEDVDTLSKVTSIESKRRSLDSYLIKIEHMPMARAEEFVKKLSDDEVDRLWKRYKKKFLNGLMKNRISRVKFKCDGDDKVKHCCIELYTKEGKKLDFDFNLINKNGKWLSE